MRQTTWFLVGALLAVAAVSRAGESRVEMRAARAATAPVIDGKLDDAVWQNAPAYPLHRPRDQREFSDTLHANGTVRFAWDDRYFYFAAQFDDDDVISYKDEDDDYLFRYGDLAELFIGPADNTWYWELYASPLGRQATIFWSGMGNLVDWPEDFRAPGVPTGILKDVRFEVAATVDGTLNDWRDVDKGWVVEMAVPVSELTKMGDAWGAGTNWLVFVGRYNYSRYLQDVNIEYATSPLITKTGFHRKKEYAKLVLAE